MKSASFHHYELGKDSLVKIKDNLLNVSSEVRAEANVCDVLVRQRQGKEKVKHSIELVWLVDK
jgi:hypothetical protein